MPDEIMGAPTVLVLLALGAIVAIWAASIIEPPGSRTFPVRCRYCQVVLRLPEDDPIPTLTTHLDSKMHRRMSEGSK